MWENVSSQNTVASVNEYVSSVLKKTYFFMFLGINHMGTSHRQYQAMFSDCFPCMKYGVKLCVPVWYHQSVLPHLHLVQISHLQSCPWTQCPPWLHSHCMAGELAEYTGSGHDSDNTRLHTTARHVGIGRRCTPVKPSAGLRWPLPVTECCFVPQSASLQLSWPITH